VGAFIMFIFLLNVPSVLSNLFTNSTIMNFLKDVKGGISFINEKTALETILRDIKYISKNALKPACGIKRGREFVESVFLYTPKSRYFHIKQQEILIF